VKIWFRAIGLLVGDLREQYVTGSLLLASH
jgi:hypothetical protein